MIRTLILDFLTGKKVWGYYKLYLKTQWFTEKEMELYQLSKLKKLLKHCYDNVPYYKTIINEKRINITDFSSLDVLKEFPVLTKEIIQKNYDAFIPINNSGIKGVKTTQTGGTTGNILLKRNDSNTRSSIWGSYKRYEDWMGLSRNKRTLILMGGHVKNKTSKEKLMTRLNDIFKNSDSIDIYNTSDETTDRIITLLKTKKYYQIRAYPQYLFSLALCLKDRGLKFDIKKISCTSEPVTDEHRILFKEIFNAEVFDQYGCGEIGGIAYECEKHEGLHIAEERVVVETNENNELIITDLDNFTMPFIRYWNADQAVISEKKCSCGRESKLLKQIMGRTCDYVTGLNGEFLHWAYFWHLIFDSNVAKTRKLRKFQVVQSATDEIKIRFVAEHLSQKEEEFIISNIRKRLGNIKVNFSYEHNIENSITGKYRPVINKLIE